MKLVFTLIGFLLMSFLALQWVFYLELLHETATWFSEVDHLNKEISFRTEQGLYYSYFKEIVSSSSFSEGYHRLRYDNITEHPDTINVFHRFNVHQEMVMGLFYRLSSFGIEPIAFYTKVVFLLQGLLWMCFFLISWSLSSNWLIGCLTASYYLVHRTDVTRVEFSIGLREHFSLPFIFLQFWLIGRYLESKRHFEKSQLLLIFVSTLLFTLMWQFSQFILLLESLVLFGLANLGVVNSNSVIRLFCLFSASLVSVWIIQFYQNMVISSLVLSFLPLGVFQLLVYPFRPHFPKSHFPHFRVCLYLLLKCLFAPSLALLLNLSFKIFLGLNDDNHIVHFLKSKLGFSDVTNFETQLYLCLPAFQNLPLAEIAKWNSSGLFPLYILGTLYYSLSLLFTSFYESSVNETSELRASEPLPQNSNWLNKWGFSLFSRKKDASELWFHNCMSIVLGILALSTLRMKCFWMPYLIIVGPVFLSDKNIWNFCFPFSEKKLLTYFSISILCLSLIGALYMSHVDRLSTELTDLRELHDPDTVELMEWINRFTLPEEAFTGSMQLLAAVKLCTRRPITNHPHFEDKNLRQKTKELYAIYSKISGEDVHRVLRHYNSTYIILEDSICLASSTNRCSLKDTMDLTNGHIPDDGIADLPSLKASTAPRFCDAIRYGSFSKLFKKVFVNRTFRVYQILL